MFLCPGRGWIFKKKENTSYSIPYRIAFEGPIPAVLQCSSKTARDGLLVRARAGGAKHSTMYLWIFAFAFPLQTPLQKVFGLNLSIHASEPRGNPISPYAALRPARLSGDETSLAF